MMFELLVETSTDSILIYDQQGTIQYTNQAALRLHRLTPPATLVGRSIAELTAPEEYERMGRELPVAMSTSGVWSGQLKLRRPDGTELISQQSVVALADTETQIGYQAAFGRDITAQLQMEEERQRAEAERLDLQEEVIRAQQAALRELSTPLIPIAAGVIALPLVGAIDSTRAQQLMEALLTGVAEMRANVAIIDITGVRVVDTQVAGALLRTAQAARLLGAEVVLTGIGPEIAQTLIGIGADLSGIVTRANFQTGIAYALTRT
jgi:PAS domain S-box-containing protein